MTGTHALASQMNLDLQRAKEFRRRFLESYPEVSVWMEEVWRSCLALGYVRTIANRRRYIHVDLSTDDARRIAEARRFAINTCVQGSASDIIKRAMLAVNRAIPITFGNACSASEMDRNELPQLVMTIHDELVFKVKKSDTAELGRLLQREMCSPHLLQRWGGGDDERIGRREGEVGLSVSLKRGEDWGSMVNLSTD